MKGDFSRLRNDRAKHYTSVLQQQGRVALDADANEQCAINEEIRGTEAIDIIGHFGGPEGDAGFAITLEGNNIRIGAGRYYVEGLLCQNSSVVGYPQQQYLLNPPISDSQLLNELANGAASAIQVFLEVWQRLVTSLDDPGLLEPALGRADTTARLQTVWRVVAEPVLPKTSPTKPPNGPVLQNAGVPVKVGTVAAPDCCLSMYQQPARPPRGTMSAQTGGATSDCSCEPTPAAGYRGLENQLYRVEIHQSGTESTATFKWSRENGSVLAGVTAASGTQVQVDSLGFDANLGFASSQWVEISDDNLEFGTPPNQPGHLYRIQSITPGQLSMTVAPAVSSVSSGRNAKLRRWDQTGTSSSPSGVPVSTAPINLENGIQIQFSAGNYTAGEYWLIPARTASGQIEWPPRDANGSAFQPPHAIEVFRAPLACIHGNAKQQFTVEDCRRLFPPLTSVAGGASAALHVTGISWSNDDFLAMDQLLATGLTLSLDQAPAGPIDSSVFSLVLEVPPPPPSPTANLVPVVLRTSMPVDGQITIQGNNINWQLPAKERNSLQSLQSLLLQGISYGAFTRARIRLRGSNVFTVNDKTPIFLDGQALGTAGVRSNGATPRISLTFPSGGTAQASDFESWLYITPPLTLLSLTLQPAVVTFSQPNVGGIPCLGTVTMSSPVASDTAVTLSVVPSPAGVPTTAVSVPGAVIVLEGTASVTFPVTTVNTGNSSAILVQIAASFTNGLGFPSTVSATLTITGFVG